MRQVELTQRQVYQIRAALRWWVAYEPDNFGDLGRRFYSIASNFNTCTPLSHEEIEELCNKLAGRGK